MDKKNDIFVITSKENEKFKKIKSLNQSKYRNKVKKYIAEGLRTVELCFQYGKKVDQVVVSEHFYRANIDFLRKLDTKILCFSDKLFRDLSDTENPQGILGIVEMDTLDICDLDKENHKKIIVLDRLQDPGNVGTIIRTADAMGFDLVAFTKGTVDIYNPKVVRSAMGSMFYMDLLKVEEEDLYRWLKENKYQIISTHLDASDYFDEIEYDDNCAIVMGNEANGINNFWEINSTKLVKIPMYGKAESLNVSVSASLMMYISTKNKK